MAASCCSGGCASSAKMSPRYRKILWIALVINVVMFVVEIIGGLHSGSVSLLADAVDFVGDAANYGISLVVFSMALVWRARAAWIKGATMAAFGIFVLAKTAWSIQAGIAPEPISMGAIAFLALIANASVALMLYTFRDGDANMRSVWLCSRNDALGNIAVMLAAGGVFGSGSAWPDWIVALLMAGLALSAGVTVMRQARKELHLDIDRIKSEFL